MIKWQDWIEERKDVMRGRPAFKGTRRIIEWLRSQGNDVLYAAKERHHCFIVITAHRVRVRPLRP
ncbi:MAG: hypothetical protein WD403_02610 [Pirellulales bacterium]